MNRIAQIVSQFPNPLYLAPMEEVSDYPFRQICKEFGADIMISEFVSSEALVREVDKSMKKMFFAEAERPFGIQIFGHHEESLVGAAQIAAAANPDFIDINWGCPVKKVVNKGAGAAILKDIPKMIQLSQAVVKAVNLPVTVKTRLGWDQDNKPIVSIVKQLQDVGIEAVTIHGRTKSQGYGGEADWQLIGEAKNNPRITIPIIGNGDIDSFEKAMNYKNRYGVDAIMVGRAAIGNPWIFKELKSSGAFKVSALTFEDRAEVFMQHLQLSAEWKGEYKAVLEIRRHVAGYFKAIYDFKSTKMALMQAKSIEECRQILTDYSKKSS
ncbi:MAG: tRNA dihydrouridine synthase DusB [Bacteroidales bacterium]|jgi:nifR3 family TIM-barrel protein|nr:tRNA dihydrouridine synthase DusB [Bacteroidales bacterium]